MEDFYVKQANLENIVEIIKGKDLEIIEERQTREKFITDSFFRVSGRITEERD